MDHTLWWVVRVRISANYGYGSRHFTKCVRVQIWGFQFKMIKGTILQIHLNVAWGLAHLNSL